MRRTRNRRKLEAVVCHDRLVGGHFVVFDDNCLTFVSSAVAYMMYDLHKEGGCLDYPMGGVGSIVDALVEGMENHGGELRVNSRVDKLLLEDGKKNPECHGVQLEDGTILKAKKGVVCNAPLWNMARILQDSVEPGHEAVAKAVSEVQQKADAMNMTGSFMHLHLGIPKKDLPDDLECHHSVLDLSKDVRDEQNLVIISIPTVFDPSLAPDGYHLIHAYTAASDSFEPWTEFLPDGETGKVGVSPNTGTASAYAREKAYEQLKEEKAEALWRAVEQVIPDVRKRAKKRNSLVMVGTPLTHRRFNQRYRGTYGPGPAEGADIWKLSGATTPIQNLLACGDTCFPGIGLPGVAASGTIAANTLTTIKAQTTLMKQLKKEGILQ